MTIRKLKQKANRTLETAVILLHALEVSDEDILKTVNEKLKELKEKVYKE